MNQLEERFSYFLAYLESLQGLLPQDLALYLLQLGIIAYVLVWIYNRVVGSSAQRILQGIILFIPLIVAIYLFKLMILIRIFEIFLPAIVIGLAVLFAPELRLFLQHLGREGFNWINLLPWITRNSLREDASIHDLTKEIVEAVEIFARNKIGALMVFDNAWSDRLYISSGQKLDAIVSTELLLNIFYPKSPLHDGAVLIREKRVHSASVILPITDNPKLNPWQYGTRHRAALGITENSSSCFCVIVSEETGAISIAEAGKIHKINSAKDLAILLETKLLSLDHQS
ncbi:MAG: diadenylate cyclase CdaA [Candidatus Caenarcaniphilales bacterium]|nr:diadenylate cyclase CdaA [Candidatus Caenarcaniphilales bacterium]